MPIIPDPIGAALANTQIEDADRSAWEYLTTRYRKQLIQCLATTILWYAGLVLAFFFWPFLFRNLLAIVWCVIGPPFILLFVYRGIKNRILKLLYQQFATRHGFTYAASGQGIYGGLFPKYGHSKNSTNIISGSFDGNGFWLCNYSYITGSSRNQERHHRTIFKIIFPAQLPRMLSLVDDHDFAVPHDYFKHPEKLELEGDFEHYFNLTVEKDFEIEALQIFTPDLMEKVSFAKRHFSLEFTENTLYVFTDYILYTRDGLETMYDLVCYLIKKIEPVALKMEPSLKAMHDRFFKSK